MLLFLYVSKQIFDLSKIPLSQKRKVIIMQNLCQMYTRIHRQIFESAFKRTVMHIEKALINDRLRVSKVS